MKQKILIIEDENSEYTNVKSRLDLDKYDVIPNTIEEFQRINDLIQRNDSESISEFKEYIRSVFENEYKTLRVVICDIRFEGFSLQGDDIIRFIRNDIEVQELKLFAKIIPIIAYTRYSNAVEGEKALLAGADINIEKEENEHFGRVVDNFCRRFTDSYVNNEIAHIESYLESYKSLLIENNRLITNKMDGIEFMIKGNHNDILKNFNTLFNAVFATMDSNKQRKFYDDFKQEVDGFLTLEQREKLDQNLWEQIKGAISELNSEGGFKQFADTVYELFDNAGILGTKGKIIGAALKGCFGLISTM